MPQVSEIARLVTDEPRFASDDQRDAWLLWRSVVEKAKRQKCHITEDGYFVYVGSLRQHVRKLWPTMDNEERVMLEKRVYAYLHVNDIARCVRRVNPVWHVAVTWHDVKPETKIHHYIPSRSEKRVTAEEAGENLPPGEVIIRHRDDTTKGQESVPTETKKSSIDALRERHARNQAEQQARRELIVEFVATLPEPAAADEIAYAMDVEMSTIRKDLHALEEEGVLFSRQETTDERKMRFGGTAYARRSNLWWSKKPVPARTQRVVVEGYMVEVADRPRPMSVHEINRRLWCRFEKAGNRFKFTGNDLADKLGLGREAVRKRLTDLESIGGIKQVGNRDVSRLFVITNKEKIREYLGQPPTAPGAEDTTPEVETPVKQETQTVTDTSSDIEAFISQVLDDNEALRKRVEELEAELEELKAPKSAVSEGLARRMQEWKPSS